jgi:hypothetical protein
MAGQIAKLQDAAQVIGSAGSDDKVKLVEEYGYDAACNYKNGPVAEQLTQAAPDGTDVFFDNVGGDRVTCPLLVMWGTEGFVGRHYDVAAVWRPYATDRSTTAITSAGNFLAEDAPVATAAALTQFLRWPWQHPLPARPRSPAPRRARRRPGGWSGQAGRVPTDRHNESMAVITCRCAPPVSCEGNHITTILQLRVRRIKTFNLHRPAPRPA